MTTYRGGLAAVIGAQMMEQRRRKQSGLRHSGMVREHQTSDVQLHIGESRDSGFDAFASPRNDGRPPQPHPEARLAEQRFFCVEGCERQVLRWRLDLAAEFRLAGVPAPARIVKHGAPPSVTMSALPGGEDVLGLLCFSDQADQRGGGEAGRLPDALRETAPGSRGRAGFFLQRAIRRPVDASIQSTPRCFSSRGRYSMVCARIPAALDPVGSADNLDADRLVCGETPRATASNTSSG